MARAIKGIGLRHVWTSDRLGLKMAAVRKHFLMLLQLMLAWRGEVGSDKTRFDLRQIVEAMRSTTPVPKVAS